MTETVNILVVDDEKGIREGCRRILSSEGYGVDVAENGKAGLEMVRGKPYDLILVDLMMPVMSGQEVLREIREARRDIATTIIISSLSSHRDDVALCARFGVQGYLVKPLNPREISRILVDLYTKANPRKASEIEALMKKL